MGGRFTILGHPPSLGLCFLSSLNCLIQFLMLITVMGEKEARGGKQDAIALSAAIANEAENYLNVANIIL